MASSSSDFEALKATLNSILSLQKEPIPIGHLLIDYKRRTGKILKFNKYGCATAEQLLREMPDVVVIIRDKRSPSRPLVCSRGLHDENLHESVLTTCRAILEETTEGYTLPRLLHEYKNLSGKYLNLRGGVERLLGLFRSRRDFVVDDSEDDLRIRLVAGFVGDGRYSHSVELYRSFFKQQEPPPMHELYEGSYIGEFLEEVTITEVINGGHFYVVLNKYNEAVSSCTKYLECFLSGSSVDRLPADEKIAAGTVCAVRLPGGGQQQFGRAEVCSIVSESTVEIKYVDLGTVATVPKRSLMTLPQELLFLPSQAIKCQLAHVKPKDLFLWNELVTEKLLRLKNETVRCYFRPKVHKQYPVVLLAHGKYFHKVLVEEGLADFTKEDENFNIFEDRLCSQQRIPELNRAACKAKEGTLKRSTSRRKHYEAHARDDLKLQSHMNKSSLEPEPSFVPQAEEGMEQKPSSHAENNSLLERLRKVCLRSGAQKKTADDVIGEVSVEVDAEVSCQEGRGHCYDSELFVEKGNRISHQSTGLAEILREVVRRQKNNTTE